MAVLKAFLRDESGATAIEYGLIAAGISVAIITVVERPRQQAGHDLHQREERAELARSARSPVRARVAGARAGDGLCPTQHGAEAKIRSPARANRSATRLRLWSRGAATRAPIPGRT